MAWSNVGTAALVLLATMDVHLVIFLLVGIVGFCYFAGLNDHHRYRHIVGALLGVGTLFLGLWLIKTGASSLRDLAFIQDMLRSSAHSMGLPFLIGTLLTLLIQSSATASAIAVTMTASGLLSLDQTLAIILGSNLGSGLSTYLMAQNLSSSGRQLALLQLVTKLLGICVFVPLLVMEGLQLAPGLKTLVGTVSGQLPQQVALLYLLLQVVSAGIFSLFSGRLDRLAARWCPAEPEDELTKPHYLYQQAVNEAESALDLVEKEQARLVRLIPRLLDELRPDELESGAYKITVVDQAITLVGHECAHFIDQLMAHQQSNETLERLMNIRSRNELILHIKTACHGLFDLLRVEFQEPAAAQLKVALVEGLCAVLLVLCDELDASEGGHEMLLMLTSDRAGVMEGIRSSLIRSDNGLGVDSKTRLLPATSLFERIIWLVNRYGVLLGRNQVIEN